MKRKKKAIPKSLRLLVEERAKGQCEYCLKFQIFARTKFHADHIIAEQHNGATTLENLAFACQFCNGFKGTNLVTMLPETDAYIPLFHPRKQVWIQHFSLEESGLIRGKTLTGRGTLKLLKFNTDRNILTRSRMLQVGLLATNS